MNETGQRYRQQIDAMKELNQQKISEVIELTEAKEMLEHAVV